MKKFKVVVQELAKTDVRKARKWYNQQQIGLGKRLTADMISTLRKVAMNPTSFAVRYQVIRLANFEVRKAEKRNPVQECDATAAK